MIRTLLLLILPAALLADVPRAPSPTRYNALWTPSSPFTTKPEVIREEREEDNPLEDYALGGVSSVEEGYFVVLINKKDPSDREVIEPGHPSEFAVDEVKYDMSGGKGTVVTVRYGRYRADIGYDEELMENRRKVAIAASAKAAAPQPTLPPQLRQAAQAKEGQKRVVRPRVVRPPTPQKPNK